jgi:hypothetical protein
MKTKEHPGYFLVYILLYIAINNGIPIRVRTIKRELYYAQHIC